MKSINNITNISKYIFSITMVLLCAMTAWGIDPPTEPPLPDEELTCFPIPNPETEVDGVRYTLNYYQMEWTNYLEDNQIKTTDNWYHRMWDMYEWLGYPHIIIINNQNYFALKDGNCLPIFEFHTQVLKSNTPYGTKLPEYDASKDDMLKRYPYYTGDVWLQDSVYLPDLPDHRKKRYCLVTKLSKDMFNEELVSIRTPRYARIESNTFLNCTGLKKARIATISEIEKESFSGCTNLETVFFEKLPFRIWSDAFHECYNIKEVIIDDTYRRTIFSEYGAFNYYKKNDLPTVYEQATLYVREDQIEKFREDDEWGRFKNIKDINIYYAQVEGIIADTDTDVDYQIYDLSGLLIKTAHSGDGWREELAPGIYIIKSSLGKVTKEYIK